MYYISKERKMTTRETTTETVEQILASDIAGRFDISEDEAARIAERAVTGEEFIAIWENEDWWKDA
jgi:hypothetical protein